MPDKMEFAAWFEAQKAEQTKAGELARTWDKDLTEKPGMTALEALVNHVIKNKPVAQEALQSLADSWDTYSKQP